MQSSCLLLGSCIAGGALAQRRVARMQSLCLSLSFGICKLTSISKELVVLSMSPSVPAVRSIFSFLLLCNK